MPSTPWKPQKNKNAKKDGKRERRRDPKKQQRRRDLKNAKYNADAVRRKQATAAWKKSLAKTLMEGIEANQLDNLQAIAEGVADMEADYEGGAKAQDKIDRGQGTELVLQKEARERAIMVIELLGKTYASRKLTGGSHRQPPT